MKLKLIAGVFPEKRKYGPFQGPGSETLGSENTNGFNEAIDQISEVDIGMNREKLAEFIHKISDYWYWLLEQQKPLDRTIPPFNIYLSNEMVANLPKLLEVQRKRKSEGVIGKE